MTRCPMTYQQLPAGHKGRYSEDGLRLLSKSLTSLSDLPFTAAEQRQEAAARATKMSIQGVQPKLSARLNVQAGQFEIVDQGGQYILKPPSPSYAHLPENEDLTMRLATTVGIEVPLHGLLRGQGGSWTYFIRRFDRPKRNKKMAVEDFAQLSLRNRTTKYNSSMEQVATVLEQFTTYPKVEFLDLFTRTIFCFLTGGEDMHLKNFSLITRGPRVQMAPAYDFLNSTIALRNPQEELALPLRGKKRKITRRDLVDYFGKERLGLNTKSVEEVLGSIEKESQKWPAEIETSFLPDELKEKYQTVLKSRQERIWPSS